MSPAILHPSARLRRGMAAMIIAVVALLVTALTESPAIAADEAALVERLRDGGYVLYFRHAQTDWSNPDGRHTEENITSCDPARMRQLSERGRETAREVGEAIRRLAIPVGDVYASEYCRSRQTAELLGLGPVRTTRDVLNALAADLIGGRETLRRRARTRLATRPPAGRNTIIVAHGNVLMLAAGRRPPEAGTAIVRPAGDGEFEVVAVWDAAMWMTLAAEHANDTATSPAEEARNDPLTGPAAVAADPRHRRRCQGHRQPVRSTRRGPPPRCGATTRRWSSLVHGSVSRCAGAPGPGDRRDAPYRPR
ncbi:histidine phosphatase family protein [Arhodomonas sp. AD133]|uniref:histidine phosphatase family protein n=1 Tax=Arhodomonas sp. AD133 TaxID=3415009 RepID=UPI003EC0AC56